MIDELLSHDGAGGLVAAGARTATRAHGRSSAAALTVVIPAYDEEQRLPAVLDRLIAHVDLRTTEVLVVDDGSADRTAAVAERLLAPVPRGRCIRLDRNRGKGGAVREGVLAATGDVIAYMDADSATDVSCLDHLVAALSAADVAVGSRSHDESVVERARLDRAVMGRAFNGLTRALTGLQLRDTQCGFKAFRAPVAKLLFSLSQVDGFAFDVEILTIAERLGYRSVEVPVVWHHVDGSKVSRLSDPVKMTVDAVRVRRSCGPPAPVDRVLRPDTALLVEGLVASGTGAVVSALRHGLDGHLAGPVHRARLVRSAARRGIPTLVVVRDPVPALAAAVGGRGSGDPARALRDYLEFHRRLLPYVDDVVVCDFDEVVTDLSVVHRGLRDRFGMDLDPCPWTAAGTDADAARPVRRDQRLDECTDLLDEARHVHDLLLTAA